MNNNEIFKPENKNISDIFSFTGIYTIPNYQRQYSWNDENLEELWDDLYNSFVDGIDKCYFLGSIVIVDRGNGEQELVDGQQRITTLMIMLNVLMRDFPEINNNSSSVLNADNSLISSLIFFNQKINRLRLQQDPDYDTYFKNIITSSESYKNFKKPTKEELKKEDPQYKFSNTAYFFYNKFNNLLNTEGPDVLGKFVNYILFKTNIIKISCFDQSFAIKLFLVLNDRGMDLANSDIIKSVIYNEFDKSEEYTNHDKEVFNSNWKAIELICNKYDFTMDDFFVFYEYYKLKKNPKRQLSDEISEIVKNSEINYIVAELLSFAKNVEKIFTKKDPVIYSLRYIPWKFYVNTSVATAYQVDYENISGLLHELRRFYYLSWISGKTLNGIKQTSFNLIEAIASKSPLEDIKTIINNFIMRNKIITNVYNTLDGNVYGESFLKPLMLSIDYNVREELLTEFYPADKEIHMDHILPKKYYERQEDWDYITNKEETLPHLNTIGNMALLLGKKNEEALNCGVPTKLQIYLGDDSRKTGRTAFDTTNWVVDEFKTEKKWTVNSIQRRQVELITQIEDMLDISRDDIEEEASYIPTEDFNNDNGYYKWEYKNEKYTNSSLVRKLLVDYINSHNFKSLEELDTEIKNYHIIPILPLLSKESILNGYGYRKLNGISFDLYTPSQFNKERINIFLQVFKKYYDFEKDLKKL
jgi:uncharacterized protein with ParB-like and HNH nuclease domain